VGSDREVDESLIENTNDRTAAFSAGGNSNTHTVYINNTADGKTISSDHYEIVGFDTTGSSEYSFELDGKNISDGVTVVVYVEPKTVELEYVYVDSQGDPSSVNPNTNTNSSTYTFNTAVDAENTLDVEIEKFVCGEGWEVKDIKYSRYDKNFNESTDSFEVEQSDLGTIIKVYVVLGEQG
jgi:hypothetical protein